MTPSLHIYSQVQRSVGSKDRVVTNGRRQLDRRTDRRTLRISLPLTNAVGKHIKVAEPRQDNTYLVGFAYGGIGNHSWL